MVSQRHPEIPDPELKDLYQVGTIGCRKAAGEAPGERAVRVLVEGLDKAELLCFDTEEPYLMGEISLYRGRGRRYRCLLPEKPCCVF